MLLPRSLAALAALSASRPLPANLGSYTVATCNASAPELDAAKEVTLWLSKLSGENVSSSGSCGRGAKPPFLAVGPGAAHALCGLELAELDGLGLEGLLLGGTDDCAFASGALGAPRGTLYAVSELLELIGVRFLHPEETLLPHNATMPPSLAHRYIPRFEYRAYDDFTATQFPQWTQRTRINSFGNWDPRWDSNPGAAVGGHVPYCVGSGNQTSPGFCHTAFNLVPPWMLKATHPEWYGGDPTATSPAGGQLCWGNASLVAFIIERVQLFLRQPTLGAEHGAKIISISNIDAFRPTWCNRSADAAIIAEEGSPMGPLLRAVNTVADAIKHEFPDVAISTLAYQHTMKPPRLTKPRPNVIIRLCVGYNNSYHIGAAGNMVFADDLATWSEISSRIYVWDYVAAFSDFGYMTPYPSWDSLAPNIRRLAAAGGSTPAVRGLFSEGDDTSMYGDLQELRSYIITRVAWNPSPAGPTYEDLVAEFVPQFYGAAAAPFVFDYLSLMTASATEHGVIGPRKWEGRNPGIFASICQAYLTPEVIIRAGALLEAASAVTGVESPGSRFIDRVARVQLPMYLTVLGRWTEVLTFWQNSTATRSLHENQPLPPWPFPHEFQDAFYSFSLIMNATDPKGRPVSDYYQTKPNQITTDDSAETAATYWHLITQGGAFQPHGATAICSAA